MSYGAESACSRDLLRFIILHSILCILGLRGRLCIPRWIENGGIAERMLESVLILSQGIITSFLEGLAYTAIRTIYLRCKSVLRRQPSATFSDITRKAMSNTWGECFYKGKYIVLSGPCHLGNRQISSWRDCSSGTSPPWNSFRGLSWIPLICSGSRWVSRSAIWIKWTPASNSLPLTKQDERIIITPTNLYRLVYYVTNWPLRFYCLCTRIQDIPKLWYIPTRGYSAHLRRSKSPLPLYNRRFCFQDMSNSCVSLLARISWIPGDHAAGYIFTARKILVNPTLVSRDTLWKPTFPSALVSFSH